MNQNNSWLKPIEAVMKGSVANYSKSSFATLPFLLKTIKNTCKASDKELHFSQVLYIQILLEELLYQ
jgi:hypothetical protein